MRLRHVVISIAALVASACGGSDGAAPADEEQGDGGPTDVDLGEALLGVLRGGLGPAPGVIAGLAYTSADLSGRTSAAGEFTYRAGEPVTFSVGGIVVATLQGAPEITMLELAGSSSCAMTSRLQSLLVLLESLDRDADATNGLSLRDVSPGATTQGLADLGAAQLNAAITAMGATPIAVASAVDSFIAMLDGEAWQLSSTETFSFLDAVQRSQGMASGAGSFYFSWQRGLQRTSTSYDTEADASSAIPDELAAAGGDHIGDIDYAGGRIYAPIEDSEAYQHPVIALYDATSLEYTGESHELPQNLHHDGVPWVALDVPRGRLYTAEWDPTTAINVFGLASFSFIETIALHSTVGRLQGAKVFRGMLYANSDNDSKTLYKVNLETGTVLPLLSLGQSDVEAEGLALGEDGAGVWLRTLTVDSYAVDLRLYRRATAPRRDSYCP
jgi:hypothetical protein